MNTRRLDERRPVAAVDLDDTTECPGAAACEGEDCGAREALAVATVLTFAGVHCLTLCEPCTARPMPAMRPVEALSRVARHAEHLGIDIDLMVELLDAERCSR